uniref:Uncharacterized protein n=1 Tax=viral metagenome TaxID=1070528 RepID=A0A6C0IJR6_9ZZZZ
MSEGQNQSGWDRMKSFGNKLSSFKNKMNNSSNSQDDSDPAKIPMLSVFTLTEIIFVYSPIFIAFIITSLSFIFQNWKGIIYLAFLIAACLLRDLIYRNGFPDKKGSDLVGNKVCDNIIFSNYGNVSFSSYVFAFTIVYLSIPMFINKSFNPWLFSLLIVYFSLDIYSKYINGCITKVPELFINVLSGGLLSLLVVLLMKYGGSSKYLFFNETQSSKEQCSQPTKQTFKCDVYKDGQLVQTL